MGRDEIGGNSKQAFLLKYLGLLFGGYLISLVLYYACWQKYNVACHTIVELACTFLLLAAFLDEWHAYEECTGINHLIGFVLFISAILNVMHMLYLARVIPAPMDNVDASMRIWAICGFIEILLLYIISSIDTGININRWLGLAVSVISSLALILIVSWSQAVIPVFVDSGRMTAAKHFSDLFMLLLAMAAINKYFGRMASDSVDERERIMLANIMYALLFFAPSRICFILSDISASFYSGYGHVLKLAYCFMLYTAIYKTTVKFPYKELKYLNEQNRVILNAAPIGFVSFDNTGRINYMNTQSEKLMGCTKEDISGVTFESFLNEYLDWQADEIAASSNQSDPADESFIYRNKRSMHSRKKLVTSVLHMSHGKMVVLIDAKKHQALENLQLQTQTILNAIDNPILIASVSNTVVMCNQSFSNMTELPYEEVAGMDVKKLDELSRFCVVKTLSGQYNGRFFIGNCEATMVTQSGKQKRVYMNSSSIKDIEGEIIGWISVGSDITDLQKEQGRIQQQEKLALIGHMAAGLVHEIKNPLASIKGFIQLVNQKSKDEKIREYAAVIENSAEDINRIVTDFLMFAKPLPVMMKNLSVNKILQAVETIIASNAFKNDVVTRFSYCGSELPIVADERQIRQVILNIVENAIHAMAGRSDKLMRLSTSVDTDLGEMRISIIDNGVGMTEEQINMVGTPFYTTKEKGTGLGISICNHIINEHGGSISINSELGKGTEFVIKLPCKPNI